VFIQGWAFVGFFCCCCFLRCTNHFCKLTVPVYIHVAAFAPKPFARRSCASSTYLLSTSASCTSTGFLSQNPSAF